MEAGEWRRVSEGAYLKFEWFHMYEGQQAADAIVERRGVTL